MFKKIIFPIIFLADILTGHAQQCTQIGTYIGTFQPSFLSYIDAENPQVVRTILDDNQISFIVNNPAALNNFDSFLDSLVARNINAILTIRFKHSIVNHKEDRIITDPLALDSTINNIKDLLDVADGRINYLQILNEPFGIGRYNTTIDSLTIVYNQNTAEQMVLAWMDTITARVRTLINNQNYPLDLISASVQSKGLEAVKNNQSLLWTYKVTLKIFEIADNYCDGLNFHWYPESFSLMTELIDYVDSASILQIDSNIFKTCTEWSQAHEIRDILQSDTSFWNNALQLHCETTDTSIEDSYIALINDSLELDHNNTFDMYELMHQKGYKFACYFAMIQDHYNCDEVTGVWYALADLYATRFTANKIPNGEFYTQYQNIKQFVNSNCNLSSSDNNYSELTPPIHLYPNPTNGILFVEYDNSLGNNYSFKLYNMFGQEILIVPHVQGNRIELNLEILPSGVYFIEFYSGSQKIKAEKFLISNMFK